MKNEMNFRNAVRYYVYVLSGLRVSQLHRPHAQSSQFFEKRLLSLSVIFRAPNQQHSEMLMPFAQTGVAEYQLLLKKWLAYCQTALLTSLHSWLLQMTWQRELDKITLAEYHGQQWLKNIPLTVAFGPFWQIKLFQINWSCWVVSKKWGMYCFFIMQL